MRKYNLKGLIGNGLQLRKVIKNETKSMTKMTRKEEILNKLLNNPKFYCLQRDFSADDFTLYTLKSKTEDDAWQEVEESCMTNNSQDWLITFKELKELAGLLQSTIKTRK